VNFYTIFYLVIFLYTHKHLTLKRPMAVVFGKPSSAMSKEISDGEKKREEEQAVELGKEGLEQLSTTLEKAMKENEHPIPESILTSLPVPDIKKVPSIPLFTSRVSPSSNSLDLAVVPDSVKGFSTEDTEAIVELLRKDAKVTASPFPIDLTHIDSKFVLAAVGIDTTPLTKEQRLYMPILEEIVSREVSCCLCVYHSVYNNSSPALL